MNIKIYVEPNPDISEFISKYMEFAPATYPDCDLVLTSRLPWGTVDRDSIQAALGAQPVYSKQSLVFLVTDSVEQFNIPPNVILFRTSLYKSKKHPNERLLPYIWDGSETAFPPKKIADKPVVGFCGLLSGNRATLIKALSGDPRIRTNFLVRDQFWGGKPHDPQLIKEFWENISESHFTVCNRGAGNFSMRFYQVLSAGRIPVVVHTDMLYPYEDEINWDDYVVRGGSDAEVIEKLLKFWQTKDIEQVQSGCRQLYEKYFEPRAFCKQTLDDLKRNPLMINQPQAREVFDLKNKVAELERFINENDQFLDYSQLGEQKVVINILERICARNKFNPTYLDIGGYHPVIGSNTARLYQQYGWKGVIVEPNPEKLKAWNAFRPNDKLICAAVVPDTWAMPTVTMVSSGDADARESVIGSLNTKSRQLSESGLTNYEAPALKFRDLMTKCNEAGLFPTFLNLDIEGLEEEVAINSKIADHRIPLLCIEHFLNEFTGEMSVLAYQNSKLVKYLEDNGYYLVSVCGISLVFCRKEFWAPYG